jgi:hypothetical protein
MAQRLVDDLDHTPDTPETPVRTWHFGVGPAEDMTTYSVDLTDENYAKLVAALQPFIDLEGTTQVAQVRSGRRSTGSTQTVREWAKKNGHKVSDRGRIPGDVQEAYNKAHRRSS